MAMELIKGKLYEFNTDDLGPDHPFCLRLADGDTSPVPGTVGNDPINGVFGGVTIRYLVPFDAPATLVFQCARKGKTGHESDSVCPINILDVDPNTLPTPETPVVVSSCCGEGCGV